MNVPVGFVLLLAGSLILSLFFIMATVACIREIRRLRAWEDKQIVFANGSRIRASSGRTWLDDAFDRHLDEAAFTFESKQDAARMSAYYRGKACGLTPASVDADLRRHDRDQLAYLQGIEDLDLIPTDPPPIRKPRVPCCSRRYGHRGACLWLTETLAGRTWHKEQSTNLLRATDYGPGY